MCVCVCVWELTLFIFQPFFSFRDKQCLFYMRTMNKYLLYHEYIYRPSHNKVRMVCSTSCAVAAIFIVAMIFTMYNSDNTKSIQSFKRILTPQQNTVYAKIANERRQIYFVGFGLGLLLSFIFLAWNTMSRTGSRRLGRCSTICIVGAITFTVNYFYYMLAPKSDWMILHIEGDTQKKAWLHIYKNMQYTYHLGALLGLVGVLFIGNVFCK